MMQPPSLVDPVRCVSLHGLAVSSPFDLAAQPSARPPMVRLRSDLDRWADSPPVGSLVARAGSDDERETMAVYEDGHSATVEFPGFVRAVATPVDDLLDVRLSAANSKATDLLSVVISPIIGALATLNGSLVLHATAVVVDGKAILLLADRGGGKSSVAALMCSAGAALLSEDVCALEHHGGAFVAHPGVQELRLRSTTPTLAELPMLHGGPAHSDGRLSVRPLAVANMVSVQRVVVVNLSRTAGVPTLDRLNSFAAVSTLLAAQRCPVVAPQSRVRTIFETVAALADSVPSSVVNIPWAAPRRNQGLGVELVELVS